MPEPATVETDPDIPTAPLSSRVWGGIRQVIIFVVLMLSSLGLYLSVEYWRGAGARICTQTTFDEAIPFWHGWVWVYLLPYLIAPPVAALLRPATFDWFIRRGLTIVLVSLLIFAVMPTRTVRPDCSRIGAGITADMYRNMIDWDEPGANAAPSLHVSLTALFAFALLRDFPRWRIVSIVSILIVWVSTLLTHQHHVIDVVTGVGLAGLVALPRWRWLGRMPA